MTPTLEQWLAFGLLRHQYIPWSLEPASTQLTVRAEGSLFNGEGSWIIYTCSKDSRVDVVIGEGFLPQRARDVASFLRGEPIKP